MSSPSPPRIPDETDIAKYLGFLNQQEVQSYAKIRSTPVISKTDGIFELKNRKLAVDIVTWMQANGAYEAYPPLANYLGQQFTKWLWMSAPNTWMVPPESYLGHMEYYYENQRFLLYVWEM